jgi:hypothetical protein
MGVTGTEHPHENSRDTPASDQSGANSGALSQDDPILTVLMKEWPRLSQEVKEALYLILKNEINRLGD